jgi:hypothetical protein
MCFEARDRNIHIHIHSTSTNSVSQHQRTKCVILFYTVTLCMQYPRTLTQPKSKAVTKVDQYCAMPLGITSKCLASAPSKSETSLEQMNSDISTHGHYHPLSPLSTAIAPPQWNSPPAERPTFQNSPTYPAAHHDWPSSLRHNSLNRHMLVWRVYLFAYVHSEKVPMTNTYGSPRCCPTTSN